jgi:hypothetical protein
MEPLVDWCVPDACTLPPRDQPLRVAEWDALFSQSARQVRRMPDRAVFVLDRTSASAASVADLADRESQCCSFLTFALSFGSDSLQLEVSSADRPDVVTALAQRAESLMVGHAAG